MVAGLFDPIRIGGGLTLKNRLVMPPMATRTSSTEDAVTDAFCEHYVQRAKYSGVGLIITEHGYIHPEGKAHAGQVSFASDENIAGFKRLTEAVHREGVGILAQISHAGSATRSEWTGLPLYAPSAVLHTRQTEELPAAMTEEHIARVTQWFVQAALRAQKAGFDGVEIHSAHGYLLNQFYSPLTNKRTDAYGAGCVEDRVRLQCEVLRAVRQAAGGGFTVAVRFGGCDYAEGGSTVEDCVQACRLLEESGADLIHLSGGMYGYAWPGRTEPGYFKDMSAPVKEAVHVPVILTGGVTAPREAEALLKEGCADMIGVGRAILKDARWADTSAK